MESARNKKTKTHILITDAGSFLGAELAKSLVAANCVVYGAGQAHLPQHLLSNRDFTLLEIDLAQPLPAFLPQFDTIYDLSSLSTAKRNLSQIPYISHETTNIISIAKTSGASVFVVAPVTTSHEFYDYLTKSDPDLKEKVSLFLVGDLYGPNMNLNQDNPLANLISQAIRSDKIILEHEGLVHIYPAYITDVTFALAKFSFGESSKKIRYLISEGAKSALSVAYSIQNAAGITLDKEIGLFFAGSQPQIFHEAEIKIDTASLGFSPKVDLSEGLKKTFQYARAKGVVVEPQSLPKIDFQGIYQHKSESQGKVDTDQPRAKIEFPRGARFKKIILATLVIILLVLAKTGIDIALGIRNLNEAQKVASYGDFEKAKKYAKNSQKSLKAASNKVKILTYPISPVAANPIKKINNVFKAAEVGTSSLVNFIEGAQVLARDFRIIASQDVKNEGFDLEFPSASFKKAYQQSEQATSLLENSQVPSFLGARYENAQKDLARLHALSQRAYELANLTDDITGQGAKKTYLVLLVNNTELRPGGGFIGNFAEIIFEDGRLKDITVEDIYTIDGQLKEKIEPPQELKDKLGIDNFYLRDSNWSGDFEINAATARDFFKKETGKDVDGAIAIDLTLVQEILAKMGPVTLADYNEQITSSNLFERGEYYSEVGFFPGSTQKRDFFGALARKIVANILDSLKSSQTTNYQQQTTNSLPWLALVEASAEGLPQKHLMLTFTDPTIAAFIKTKGWNNPLPPVYFDPADDSGQTRDFVAIVEANLGANKVNRALVRNISYEMTIGRDADLVGSLKITYTNNSQAETWPAGKYVNFLRVYVPFAAGLFEYQNGDSTNLEEVQTATQGNLTVFSTTVVVPIRSQKEVSFIYRIPKNIKLEDAPTYSVYFQKQAGTERDPLEFKFNLPAYIEVKSVNGDEQYKGQQNITISTDLSTDRQFEIEVAKK